MDSATDLSVLTDVLVVRHLLFPLHDLTFRDGLSIAIMDMEKLKKMQQSVRIGMLERSNSSYRNFEGPELQLPFDLLFQEALVNS